MTPRRTAARTLWYGAQAHQGESFFIDDLADAAAFLMQHDSAEDIVNVGVGEDTTIRELAELTAAVVGYKGYIVFDAGGKPDGTPRNLLDVSRLRARGWQSRIGLRQGIGTT